MKRLIVNADDFGLTPGVNLGVMQAYQRGIVTSATLMVGMPAAPEALALARQTPGLAVGLHIALTAGRPLTAGVATLTGPDGRFLKLPELARQASAADLEREIDAQIAAFRGAGLEPTHFDSHHHVHMEWSVVGDIVADRARRLAIPVRGMQPGVAFTARFYGRAAVTVDGLVALLAGIMAGQTLEIMTHPAYLDPDLLRISSYGVERVHELAALTDPAVREAVRQAGIRLISYRDVAGKERAQ